MNKRNVTYRTSGSAALKPEYRNNSQYRASIIDFNQVKPRKTVRVSQPKSRILNSRVVKFMDKNAKLGSLEDAFAHQQKASKQDRKVFACTFVSFFVFSLVLVLIGA